jgi:heme exporter protein D
MKSNMMWNLNWASASDFLAMGGYGLYVWGSFGVTAVVMLLEMWSLSARRKALRDLMTQDDASDLENS